MQYVVEDAEPLLVCMNSKVARSNRSAVCFFFQPALYPRCFMHISPKKVKSRCKPLVIVE